MYSLFKVFEKSHRGEYWYVNKVNGSVSKLEVNVWGPARRGHYVNSIGGGNGARAALLMYQSPALTPVPAPPGKSHISLLEFLNFFASCHKRKVIFNVQF